MRYEIRSMANGLQYHFHITWFYAVRDKLTSPFRHLRVTKQHMCLGTDDLYFATALLPPPPPANTNPCSFHPVAHCSNQEDSTTYRPSVLAKCPIVVAQRTSEESRREVRPTTLNLPVTRPLDATSHKWRIFLVMYARAGRRNSEGVNQSSFERARF